VRIRSFSHKPLKRFYEDGIAKGLPADAVPKLRAMFAVLDQMNDVGELRSWPLWKVHTLTGDRKGTWSLHVTRNWRLTFGVDADELLDVNFEDYH
jgi:proteic killer suppression protein